MKSRIIVVSILSLIVLLAACTPADKTDPIVGTWNLTSATLGATSYTSAQLTSAGVHLTFVASSDNTYTVSGMTFSESGVAPMTDSGTWSVVGSNYTITSGSGGSPIVGVLSGNTFTVTTTGSSMVFTKS